jgi:hypothetical protein
MAGDHNMYAGWEPLVEWCYDETGALLHHKIKRTPDGEWEDCDIVKPRVWKGLSTAEVKVLWNLTKKPSEFAAAIEAKLREKNEKAT